MYICIYLYEYGICSLTRCIRNARTYIFGLKDLALEYKAGIQMKYLKQQFASRKK